ncbi:cytidine deaminase [uncultured Ruthenibacterium sp.]|uniref:cytidine deaminase n=1 Tax=uncultured Ruthenibacterium sp. TaxID=1905347 RepID=UPI00349ED7D5
MNPDYKALIHEALRVRENAYAPYSGFRVGAALLAKDGTIYTGCNVECASFSATNCAERTALFKAVSEGKRKFCALAIVGGKGDPEKNGIIAPCGVCRQMLYEFCGEKLDIVMAQDEEHFTLCTLGELLPVGFGPQALL